MILMLAIYIKILMENPWYISKQGVPKSKQGSKKLVLTFFMLFTKLTKCKEKETRCYDLENVSFAVHETIQF